MIDLFYQAMAILGAALGTVSIILIGITFEVLRDNRGPRGPMGPPGPPGPIGPIGRPLEKAENHSVLER